MQAPLMLQQRNPLESTKIVNKQFSGAIAHLNGAFLSLLTQEDFLASSVHWPSVELAMRLRNQSWDECLLAGQCPFALFDLRLDRWPGPRLATRQAPVLPPWAGFVYTAGGLVWNLVRQDDFMAAQCFGMTPILIREWRAMSLPHLELAARDMSPELKLRWSDSTYWWGLLVDGVEQRHQSRFKQAHRRGVQIQGAQMRA